MTLLKLFIVASLFLYASCGSSNEASNTSEGGSDQPDAGKTLFNSNCVQCHSMSTDKNGPKLSGAIERWGNDTGRLITYIKNSQEVIKTDPYAAKLFSDWSNMVMPSFPNLNDAEVKEIIRYIGKGQD
jgi:mono/diheme cytochrome c family protein